MADLALRDANALATESTLVSVGAGIAALLTTALTTMPLASGALAGALFGGSICAAATRKPLGKVTKLLLGGVGGALCALGFSALATRFGLGDLGVVVGGALGGTALGALLSIDGGKRASQGVGVVLGGVLGAVGADAALHVARFAESTDAPAPLASAVIASLFGLWVTAGAGARRLERTRDPLVDRAEAMCRAATEDVKGRLERALAAYRDIEAAARAPDELASSSMRDACEQSSVLLATILDTASALARFEADLGRAHVADIDKRLAELAEKSARTSDAVTLAHLARATQALRAQRAAVDGLTLSRARADAALDAQLALIERLRLAVAQFVASDHERFALELAAVGEQVARLSDDLDSLSSAIAEAEAMSDRRLLADIERTGRRALDALQQEAARADVEHVRR